MRSIITKIVEAIKTFGFGAGLVYGIDQAMIRQGSRYRLYFYELMTQPVTDHVLVPENLTSSIEVREIYSGDPLLDTTPPPSAVIASRFRQNAVCFGAFRNSEFIGYQWFCFGEYEEDEVRATFVPLPSERAVFDFDIYLFPDHRFGIGFIALWSGSNKVLYERGIRYTCSRVSRFNLQSRKSHSHLGWKCVGKLLFLKGRSFQLMIGTVAPYIHISTDGISRPRIEITAPKTL